MSRGGFLFFFLETLEEREETEGINCLCFPAVRQRQEEKRQQEESSKVKERKRKREKYAEKVQLLEEEVQTTPRE